MTEEQKPQDDYESRTTEEPAREVSWEVPQGGPSAGKSYSEAEESGNLSDLQAAYKKLLPKFPIPEIDAFAQTAMVGRIEPDIFLDLIRMNALSVAQQMDRRDSEAPILNFQEVVDHTYSAYSIGLSQKARVEIIELHGHSADEKELERLSKAVGIS